MHSLNLDQPDGVTAVGTDRVLIQRSPFGPGKSAYLTCTELATFFGGSFAPLTGQSFVFVGTKSTAAANGTELVAAYATAIASTPYGAALSATNRFTIFLLPGNYALSDGALILSANFVDLIGVATNPDEVFLTSSGKTMRITVGTPDITLANFRLHTTASAPTSQSSSFAYNVETTAVVSTPTFRHLNLKITAATNLAAWRSGVVACGYYEDVDSSNSDGSFGWGLAGTEACSAVGTFIRCKGQDIAFGGTSSSTASATLSGTFIDCEAREFAFGWVQATATATLSGTFLRCKATGSTATRGAFGAGTTNTTAILSGLFIECMSTGACPSFGGHTSTGARTMTLSGIFINCYAAGSGSFAGAATSASATATLSGTFVGCVGAGNAFGGAVGTATLSGTFVGCSATSQGFGGGSLTTVLSGQFTGCSATTNSFAGVSSGVNTSTITGTLTGCTATTNAFAGSGAGTGGSITSTAIINGCTGTTGAFAGGTTGGTLAGVVTNCTAGNNSFAGGSTTGGTLSGKAYGCTAGSNSFAGGGTTGGTMSGECIDCRSTAASPAHCFGSAATNKGTLSGALKNCRAAGFLNANVNATGRIEDMRIEATGTDQTAITISASGATLYNVTAIGTGTGKSIDAGSAFVIKAAHCRLNKGFGSNVTTSIATPYNVDDANIT